MRFKSTLMALALAAGSLAAPATAALHTLNFTGTWLFIDPSSTSWSYTDPISMVVTYDDAAPSGDYPDAYLLDAPGTGVTFTVGSQIWTEADYIPAYVADPFITFATPTGPKFLRPVSMPATP